LAPSLVAIGLAAWLVAAVLALVGRGLAAARGLLVVGALALIGAALLALPGGLAPVATPLGLPPVGSTFALAPEALWLIGFGLPGVLAAAWLGTPSGASRAWTFGVAASLVGALGVFAMQDAVTFLVAWEIMSLGGAVMILGERLSEDRGRPVLFMLALLEAGSVALLVAFILLANAAGSVAFADFAAAAAAMPLAEQLFVALLLLVGFGAKLGLLPFYEWFPGAYGAGSGASGAILSGVVLNAAFFGLARGLMEWLPVIPDASVSPAGIVIVAVAVVSAILTALYAFQQESWRELLSLSSAENGSIAVALIGIALMFRQDGLADLAGLAWTVAAIHLAGHALAKGTMFLAADGVFRATGSYQLRQGGILRASAWVFGAGALFAAMSLAAMPPQAGFVSEWFLFQTFFQGFHLARLASRLVAALAGAGLALTAAVAFATSVKAFGIGLLGRAAPPLRRVPRASALAVGALGLAVLALAVGMPIWLHGLSPAVERIAGSNAPALMRHGWLLVPLTADFAFISPSKLIIVMPLLALLPVALLAVSMRRGLRRSAVWYGGASAAPRGAATTALTFSNALRTFSSFVYRPTVETERQTSDESNGHPYFIRRLTFTHDVAPIFGPLLFRPLESAVIALSRRLSVLQSGDLNAYLATIGILLVAILIVLLF
jgi:hydrogenase-4 component B